MFILSSVIFSIIVNKYVNLLVLTNIVTLVVFFYSGVDYRCFETLTSVLLHPHTPNHTPYSTAAYTGYMASFPHIGPCDPLEL